jgi:hypothetical protein
MRYPLLIEAGSNTITGPSVYLPPGEWEIEYNGFSEFVIVLDSSFPEEAKSRNERITGDRLVHVKVLDFKDRALSVYAKKCQSV